MGAPVLDGGAALRDGGVTIVGMEQIGPEVRPGQPLLGSRGAQKLLHSDQQIRREERLGEQ
jgi:hypothetical protein